MAVDRAQITQNLARFYDFSGKVVLYVGAGGQQLLEPGTKTKKLIAIDGDAKSLRPLQTKVTTQRLHDSISVINARFEDVDLRGDVVYFEFCLHEISDLDSALRHARALAPDIVILDHLPRSPWTFYAAEEDEVRRGAEAVERFEVRKREVFSAEQRFADYDELVGKLTSQGAVALERIKCFAQTKNIVIPMDYQLALL